MRLRGTVGVKREPVVRLRVRGPSGSELTVDAVVDTGFGGSLALPAAVIVALGLSTANRGGARLGDGAVRQFDLYDAEVEWGGWQAILVAGIGREALVGMRLLAGHRLRIDVVPGGAVEITRLP